MTRTALVTRSPALAERPSSIDSPAATRNACPASDSPISCQSTCDDPSKPARAPATSGDRSRSDGTLTARNSRLRPLTPTSEAMRSKHSGALQNEPTNHLPRARDRIRRIDRRCRASVSRASAAPQSLSPLGIGTCRRRRGQSSSSCDTLRTGNPADRMCKRHRRRSSRRRWREDAGGRGADAAISLPLGDRVFNLGCNPQPFSSLSQQF